VASKFDAELSVIHVVDTHCCKDGICPSNFMMKKTRKNWSVLNRK
jgi:hypothetical protein